MPKNFFNLPPPWNPGYALPSNVKDEGLERHAYVTKMLARGTYDASTDGSAGYAIPQYVLAEKTGRGTFTTKWTPRGYYGPGIPHYLNRQPVANIVLGDTAAELYAQHVAQNNRPGSYGDQNRPGTSYVTPEGRSDRGKTAGYTSPNKAPASGGTGDRRPGSYARPPAPVMVPPPTSSPLASMGSMMPLLLLGGAAFVAYKLFTRKPASTP